MFNLRLAMRHFGYRDEVTVFPDPAEPDLLARVVLGLRLQSMHRSDTERAMSEAIRRRHTHRMLFEQRELPKALLQELKDAARCEKAVLRLR